MSLNILLGSEATQSGHEKSDDNSIQVVVVVAAVADVTDIVVDFDGAIVDNAVVFVIEVHLFRIDSANTDFFSYFIIAAFPGLTQRCCDIFNTKSQ